ncbi:MAG TPA: hypothetical protein VMT70_23090 [Vicinamibacteria bacterium]|nr:hypothetical protein [Vicinamibacteria bacterium]
MLIWGVFSAQLLARAWIAWLGVPIYLAGLAFGRGSRSHNRRIAACVAQLVVFAVLLGIGDILVRSILHLGHTGAQQVVYWSSAGVAFVVSVWRGRHLVTRMWREAMAETEVSESRERPSDGRAVE